MAPSFGQWTYEFLEMSVPATQVIDITEHEGIVFVRRDSILRQLGHGDLKLLVDVVAKEMHNNKKETIKLEVNVSILHTGRACGKWT